MQIIVIDDDPTGSQTVSQCPLILSWDKEVLQKEINNLSPLLFLLGNTRSMISVEAEETTREICNSLKNILDEKGINLQDIFFISRGDSTLRGYGFLEPKIIHEELGPFDATFHIPAFFEGGRTTINSIHLLNGIPMHQTQFAKDNIFGYSSSYLPTWLEEKSNGEISNKDVQSISLDELEMANRDIQSMNKLIARLIRMKSNQSVVVDATEPHHLASFACAVRSLKSKKRFLFRSAASFINALSKISPTIQDLTYLRLKNFSGKFKPGLVMVGSHVKLADDQLQELLKENECKGIEISVEKFARILEGSSFNYLLADLESIYIEQINQVLNNNQTPVLYSSRKELNFQNSSLRMKFGIDLAESMARIAHSVYSRLGYIISKGGITTQVLLSKGLNLKRVDLKGQIFPGLSVVCPDQAETKYPLPIVTFPGNLGDQNTLLLAWKIMELN